MYKNVNNLYCIYNKYVNAYVIKNILFEGCVYDNRKFMIR